MCQWGNVAMWRCVNGAMCQCGDVAMCQPAYRQAGVSMGLVVGLWIIKKPACMGVRCRLG